MLPSTSSAARSLESQAAQRLLRNRGCAGTENVFDDTTLLGRASTPAGFRLRHCGLVSFDSHRRMAVFTSPCSATLKRSVMGAEYGNGDGISSKEQKPNRNDAPEVVSAPFYNFLSHNITGVNELAMSELGGAGTYVNHPAETFPPPMSRSHFRWVPSQDLDLDPLTPKRRTQAENRRKASLDPADTQVVEKFETSPTGACLLYLAFCAEKIAAEVLSLSISVVFGSTYGAGCQNQGTVSFLITAITQTFGTTLSTRQSLRREQSLAATHDIASAWAGIGSAVVRIWRQNVISSSVMGVLSVFLYLGGMLVFHITTPALFAVETFNSSQPLVFATEGLPAYNLTGYDLSSIDSIPWVVLDNLTSYAHGSLYYLPYVDGITTIGLRDGTLYESPNPSTGIGAVNLNATGFNITCGYWDDISAGFSDGKYLASRNVNGSVWTSEIQFTLLYSTTPIVDSTGNDGSSVALTPPMNTSVSSIQIFRCLQSLVNQTAVVDVQTRQAVTLEPELKKTSSTWQPYTGPPTRSNNAYIDGWAAWYTSMPRSEFPFDEDADMWSYVSLADLYLIEKLNLHPTNNANQAPRTVTLHDVENTLSELVASMFWILGHIPPTHEAVQAVHRFGAGGDTFNASVGGIQSPVFLVPGAATVSQNSVQARLDVGLKCLIPHLPTEATPIVQHNSGIYSDYFFLLSCTDAKQISVGLAASIALLLLSLTYSIFHIWHRDRSMQEEEANTQLDGTGILHTIWMYRDHAELGAILEHVEHPTDNNLREAGMVRVRMVGGRRAGTSRTDLQE
ncbi:hypothetical protein C8R45DRAFT_924052 [Mycena sanguinolenta]|nr:hypothetical protein C8R45DRAFT_924052 [Mycena sanguinolenta]